MTTEYQKPLYRNNISGIFAGMLIGGLAGAITVVLLAPQSGKETRDQIQKKGIELRDRTNEMMEDTVAQVRSRMGKITVGGSKKMKELQHQGKELALEQLDRVSAVVKAGKSAMENV